jgi:hypothetical protein
LTREEVDNLKPGDLVKYKETGEAFLVDHYDGDQNPIGVREAQIYTPEEWDILSIKGYKDKDAVGVECIICENPSHGSEYICAKCSKKVDSKKVDESPDELVEEIIEEH